MGQKRKTLSGFQLDVLRQFPPNQKYLIGVSGGRDSVVLLHQLVDRGYRRLHVCHLDHRLRGKQSRTDARFVEKLAQGFDLDVELGSVDVRALAAKAKISIETAGRDARYRFFGDVSRRRRCRTIFLGHHADDLVETFLMNLFRGAGPVGFGGMREITSRRISRTELRIVRPLLAVWRQEIDQYVRARRLNFRDDISNESLAPVRNRMRRRVIPYIEKQLGRNVRSAIWRAAIIAADEAEWIEGFVDSKQTESEHLDTPSLRAQPRALQRRTVHKWLQSRGVGDLDFDLIERVRALLYPEATTAKTNLPRDSHVRRRAKKIFVE